MAPLPPPIGGLLGRFGAGGTGQPPRPPQRFGGGGGYNTLPVQPAGDPPPPIRGYQGPTPVPPANPVHYPVEHVDPGNVIARLRQLFEGRSGPVSPGYQLTQQKLAQMEHQGNPYQAVLDMAHAGAPGATGTPHFRPADAERAMGETGLAAHTWMQHHKGAARHGHIPGWVEQGLLSGAGGPEHNRFPLPAENPSGFHIPYKRPSPMSALLGALGGGGSPNIAA